MSAANPAMTLEELRVVAQSPTCDVPTAGRAFGLGINASYQRAEDGTFPVRVLKLGRKLRVPTADLLRTLGIDINEDDSKTA